MTGEGGQCFKYFISFWTKINFLMLKTILFRKLNNQHCDQQTYFLTSYNVFLYAKGCHYDVPLHITKKITCCYCCFVLLLTLYNSTIVEHSKIKCLLQPLTHKNVAYKENLNEYIKKDVRKEINK